MRPLSLEHLRSLGFAGFRSVRALRADRCVARDAGVYAVIRTAHGPPRLLSQSRGGRFKGKDPTVSVSVLEARWVPGSPVVYISMSSSLQRRVRSLVDYGGGRPTGHLGGRYLWQIDGADDFLVGWRQDPDPGGSEIRLLNHHLSSYGAFPFANIGR